MPDEHPLPTFAEFVTALYDDPLRAETVRRGRWLVGLSLVAFLVALFGAQFKPESLLSVTFPNDSPAVRGALALLIFLFWIEFFFRSIMDWFREKEIRLIVTTYVLRQRRDRQAKVARKIDNAMPDRDEEPSEPDPWWEPVAVTDEELERRVDVLETQLGERKVARAFRACRVYFEVVTPLLLGLMALWLLLGSLGKLLTTVLLSM